MTETVCRATGEIHSQPPYLFHAFPQIKDRPNLIKIITVAATDCTPCSRYHRTMAVQHASLLANAVNLVLHHLMIMRVEFDLPPVSYASDLFGGFPAGAQDMRQRAFHGTIAMLSKVELSVVNGPEGQQANIWESAPLLKAVEELNPEHREMVWDDVRGFLLGSLLGAQEALTEKGVSD